MQGEIVVKCVRGEEVMVGSEGVVGGCEGVRMIAPSGHSCTV